MSTITIPCIGTHHPTGSNRVCMKWFLCLWRSLLCADLLLFTLTYAFWGSVTRKEQVKWANMRTARTPCCSLGMIKTMSLSGICSWTQRGLWALGHPSWNWSSFVPPSKRPGSVDLVGSGNVRVAILHHLRLRPPRTSVNPQGSAQPLSWNKQSLPPQHLASHLRESRQCSRSGLQLETVVISTLAITVLLLVGAHPLGRTF